MNIILIFENFQNHNQVLLKALKIDTSPLGFLTPGAAWFSDELDEMNVCVWTENAKLFMSKKTLQNSVMWSGFQFWVL